MLGREVNHIADLMYPMSEPNQAQSPSDYVQKLEQEVARAHSQARKTLAATQKRMKRDHDVRIFEKSFEVGDLVYILNSGSAKGKSKKLQKQWKGPGIVVNRLSPYLYRVKLRYAILTTHHDKMKKCQDRDIPTWLLKFKKNKSLLDKYGDQGDDSSDVYCTCRKPFRGEFMIQCDSCSEWYHGRCVNVTQPEAIHFDVYKCPLCSA
jgi:hypothetical protein